MWYKLTKAFFACKILKFHSIKELFKMNSSIWISNKQNKNTKSSKKNRCACISLVLELSFNPCALLFKLFKMFYTLPNLQAIAKVFWLTFLNQILILLEAPKGLLYEHNALMIKNILIKLNVYYKNNSWLYLNTIK